MQFLSTFAALGVFALFAACAATPPPTPSQFAINGVCNEACVAMYAAALENHEVQTEAQAQARKTRAVLAVNLIRLKRPNFLTMSEEDRSTIGLLCVAAKDPTVGLPGGEAGLASSAVEWCDVLLATIAIEVENPPAESESPSAPAVAVPPEPSPAAVSPPDPAPPSV